MFCNNPCMKIMAVKIKQNSKMPTTAPANPKIITIKIYTFFQFHNNEIQIGYTNTKMTLLDNRNII